MTSITVYYAAAADGCVQWREGDIAARAPAHSQQPSVSGSPLDPAAAVNGKSPRDVVGREALRRTPATHQSSGLLRLSSCLFSPRGNATGTAGGGRGSWMDRMGLRAAESSLSAASQFWRDVEGEMRDIRDPTVQYARLI